MIPGHAGSRVRMTDIMRPAVALKHALTHALQQSQDSHRWLEEGATAYAGSTLTLHHLVENLQHSTPSALLPMQRPCSRLRASLHLGRMLLFPHSHQLLEQCIWGSVSPCIRS